MRTDDTVAADPGSIKDCATDTDEQIVSDRAAVKHDPVSDGYVIAYDEFNAGIGVKHRAVLDVAVHSDFDQIVVAPQHCVKPDAGALFQCDTADNRSGGGDEMTVSLQVGVAIAQADYHPALA